MAEDVIDLRKFKKNVVWGIEEYDGSDSSIIARSEVLRDLPALIKELERSRKKGNDIIKSGRAIQVGGIRIPVEVAANEEGIELIGRLSLFDFINNDSCTIILDSMGLDVGKEYETLARVRALESTKVSIRITDKESE